MAISQSLQKGDSVIFRDTKEYEALFYPVLNSVEIENTEIKFLLPDKDIKRKVESITGSNINENIDPVWEKMKKL